RTCLLSRSVNLRLSTLLAPHLAALLGLQTAHLELVAKAQPKQAAKPEGDDKPSSQGGGASERPVATLYPAPVVSEHPAPFAAWLSGARFPVAARPRGGRALVVALSASGAETSEGSVLPPVRLELPIADRNGRQLMRRDGRPCGLVLEDSLSRSAAV